jgi:glycosyltransferase involved in cell wall biosynthesis
MSEDKGAHRAIEVARRAGLPLKIAAKCTEPEEHAYFEARVHPHLGATIEYVGEVAHAQKIELLQGARALLCPISWEEPFGIAMIEAMACGTPVIATRRGAVPEVVADGRSGVVVDDVAAFPDAIVAADALDPAVIRRTAEEKFSPDAMVASYLEAYGRLLKRPPASSARAARPSLS